MHLWPSAPCRWQPTTPAHAQVIETVVQYGGGVMRFAGDSIICCFSPTVEEARAQDQGLAAATLRCVRCTADLAANLSEPLPQRATALQLLWQCAACLDLCHHASASGEL